MSYRDSSLSQPLDNRWRCALLHQQRITFCNTDSWDSFAMNFFRVVVRISCAILFKDEISIKSWTLWSRHRVLLTEDDAEHASHSPSFNYSSNAIIFNAPINSVRNSVEFLIFFSCTIKLRSLIFSISSNAISMLSNRIAIDSQPRCLEKFTVEVAFHFRHELDYLVIWKWRNLSVSIDQW